MNEQYYLNEIARLHLLLREEILKNKEMKRQLETKDITSESYNKKYVNSFLRLANE